MNAVPDDKTDEMLAAMARELLAPEELDQETSGLLAAVDRSEAPED